MTSKDRKPGKGDHPPLVDTAALLDGVDIVKVIDGYVPLTKSGAEFEACCPFHTEATPSFKVSPSKQFYNCFGCGANGDAIKFLQEYRGLSFLDACRELGADIPESGAVAGPPKPPAPIKRESVKPKADAPVWTAIMPVPEDVPAPPKAHFKRGMPAATWSYLDAEGRQLGYVYRFNTSEGGKETLPLVWAQSDAGKREWHWLSFPKPRPLYGLDRLAARPDATVLLVEGEKCADAGAKHLPDLVVVSWPGGGKAVGKVDWSPLAGRKVITWADCDAKRVPLTPDEIEAVIDDPRLAGMIPGRDKTLLLKELREQHRDKVDAAQAMKPLLPEPDQPGVKAMAAIHKQLHALGAAVWQMKIPAPGEKADGWDIADAIDEGLQEEKLAEHVRASLVRVAEPAAVDETPLRELAAEGISTPSGACASPPDYGDDDGCGHGDSIWRRMLARKDGKLVDCRENVYMILKYHPAWSGVLWADEFSKKIIMRKPPPWRSGKAFEPGVLWDDNDALRLGLWLIHQERLIVKNVQNLTMAVGWAASENRCHPVREYLDDLLWDGTSRVNTWLTDFMGVKESNYSQLAGRFFLLGMVARIYRPGCQMRFMPIFEGRQYRGKSSALRILGGKWFSDTPLNLHNKDSYQLIQGCWVYEIAELDSFSRADATLVKAFVSSQTDRFRAPYKAAPEDHGRQGVFGGSTNEGEYFKDETGNTRYWPLRCEEVDSINLQGLAENRDQLFAEAVALFRAGERWHPTSEEQQTLFEPEQAEREVMDPWAERIAVYLKASTVRKVTALELLTDCLKVEVGKIGRAKAEAMAISKIMRRLKWKKVRETGGNRLWCYERPPEEDSERPSELPSQEVCDVPI